MSKVMISIILFVTLLFATVATSWAAATYTSATGKLHIPCINVPGTGAFEADLRTGWPNMALDVNLEFELENAKPCSVIADIPATYDSSTGLAHIPVLAVPDTNVGLQYYEVSLAYLAGTEPKHFKVTQVSPTQIGGNKYAPPLVYDANGQFLGVLVDGISPSGYGVTLFIRSFNRFVTLYGLELDNIYIRDSVLYFLTDDCTGQPYLGGEFRYFVVTGRYDGKSYLTPDNAISTSISYYQTTNGECRFLGTPYKAFPAQEVASPFTLPIASPLSFR